MKKAELKNCLVTGGSGFLGEKLARALIERGCRVIVYDLAPCTIQHERLEYVRGDICHLDQLTKALAGVDTVFHTAAFIALLGGRSCSREYRKKAFAVNVDGTKNVIQACISNGVQRLVYTSSNNVCFKRRPLSNSCETEPYCTDYIDLYTETKSIIEPIVLEESGKRGLLTCAIRPSGIYGPGDKLVLKAVVENLVRNRLKARIGDGSALADNSYIDNLVHGEMLAAEHLVTGGAVAGEAYSINDGDPRNYFEFFKPIIEDLGYKFPKLTISGNLLYGLMFLLQSFYFRFGKLFNMAEPIPPIGIRKTYVDNYFSIEKARRDMGYEPIVPPEEAMRRSVEYCRELYRELQQEHGITGKAVEC